MLSQSIVNEEQLCEAEALLANLKNRWNLVHRYDAEIELLLDDEDELSSEIDSSALFDEKASIAIARLESTAKNPNKQLQNLLKKALKSCNKIVIWHDLVNNSLSSHKSNGNRNCSPDVFIKILEPFGEQITAIIYNQRIGTPNIHKKLVEASYITISPKQHLLSNRKRRSAEFSQELWKMHPLERIELHILQIILHHQNNLHRLLKRNRSKSKKNLSQKRRKRLAKKK